MKLKKTSVLFFLVFFLVFSLCTPAFADGVSLITDEAGLLSEEDRDTLESMAEEYSEASGCNIYIVTVPDYLEYTNASDIVGAAQEIYFGNDFGYGEEKSGIMLLLSMADRDYALYAFGYGNTAFTDYGKEYLADAFLDDFGEDSWYNGFYNFIATSDQMLTLALDGSPVDVDNVPADPNARMYGIVACILLGFLIAFLVRMYLKNQLKSVYAGDEADAFVTEEGLQLHERYDQYSHTTQSRVYSPEEKDNDSGGTTTDSFGGSSSSGKF